MDEFSNRVGRFFRGTTMSRGDSVALVMESRVEYIATWLGLSKAGFVTALVNINLRGDVLVHSINVANCKAVIFSEEFKQGACNIQYTYLTSQCQSPKHYCSVLSADVNFASFFQPPSLSLFVELFFFILFDLFCVLMSGVT